MPRTARAILGGWNVHVLLLAILTPACFTFSICRSRSVWLASRVFHTIGPR